MSEAIRYRIVLDTNVIVAAGSRWLMSDPPAPLPNNLASQIVYCVIASHKGLYCDDILMEYAEKLEFFGHSLERISEYLGTLVLTCEKIEIVTYHYQPLPSDSDDIIFVVCAMNGHADFLVSDDNDLLALRHDYDPPKIRSREEMRVPLVL